MININNILRCFPLRIAKIIDDFFIKENVNVNLLEEIRLRINCPILLKMGENEIKLEHNVMQEELIEILGRICENSIYTYQNQICKRIYNNSRRT